MSVRKRYCSAAIFFLLMFCSSFQWDAKAQSRTSSAIGGVVYDEQENQLPGATVEIASSELIGSPRNTVSDAKGRFRFSQLPPGSYQISARLAGYKTVRIENFRLSVGLAAEIPIHMVLYAGEQTVTIHAKPDTTQPTSSSVSTILPQDYLQNIPSDRETSHILDFAPGINLESAYGGAEESGIAYQMDGIDISDPQAGAPWSLFNYSLIDQVQLVGIGAPAEYGQFTGVVYNTVTKSGGNTLSGQLEFFYTGKSLTATDPASADLIATVDSHHEGAFQIGGPVTKDKLWFFADAQYIRDLSTEGGPIQTEVDPRIFGKLTFLANRNNVLEGWLAWDHTKITGKDADAFTPLIATTGEDDPEIVGNLSWKSTTSKNSALDVSWGGYRGHHDFDPQNGFAVPGHVDASTGFVSSNAAQFGFVNRNRNQLNASFSQQTSNFLTGFHDFKTGMEVERSFVHDRFGYPGGAFFSDNEGPEQDPSTGHDDFFSLKYISGGYDATGIDTRLSLYAQDDWRIRNDLTVNAGVRIDLNRGRVPETGMVFKTNPLAPRIGFAWDFGGKSQSVLRAHYGRYYEALYSAFYYYMQPGAFSPLTIQKIFNHSGFTETISSNAGQQYAMDPNIKQPQMDQFVIGFDQQLPFDIVLSGTFVARNNSNFIETVSRDGIFIPVAGLIPGTGQSVTLYDYLNPDSDVLIYTNPRGLSRNYRAFIVSITRRMSRNWQLDASYVYSRARGNIDNLGFDESGLGANTPFFQGHFLDTPNSLLNAEGRLTHDQTHQIKLQGIWMVAQPHLLFSADYTFYTGDTWTPRTNCLLTDDGNGIIGDGILDCHEFPQGPFLYFAESRGSRRLPARNEIDVRVEWQHLFSQESTLGIFADVFNLTNQRRATSVESIMDDEFGHTATLNFPRNIRLGVKYEW